GPSERGAMISARVRYSVAGRRPFRGPPSTSAPMQRNPVPQPMAPFGPAPSIMKRLWSQRSGYMNAPRKGSPSAEHQDTAHTLRPSPKRSFRTRYGTNVG